MFAILWRRLLPVFLFAGLAGNVVRAETCHVKPDASSDTGGLSWTDAMTLQAALAAPQCNQVWVAAGIYKPTWSSDQSISFDVHPGVAVYGGFAGTESVRTQRDPAANITVLSGDIEDDDDAIGGIDATTDAIHGSNSYHVVTMDGTTGTRITASTVLDGFVITGGQATAGAPDNGGGGLYCNASSNPANECDPTLSNLVFSGNLASTYGGALFNWAIYGGSASPTLINVTFSGNRVYPAFGDTAYGGAIYNEGYGGVSSPTLINVTFNGNSSSGAGGAMYNDGYDGISSPVLTNVTFSGNTAVYGGAIFNSGVLGGVSRPILTNVILWGDYVDAGGQGAEIYEDSASAQISYSVVQGGCPSGSSCFAHLISADPKLGPLQDNGGFARTIALGGNSPAIDAGSDASCPATDERGIARPEGPHCDVGAYELVGLIFADSFESR